MYFPKINKKIIWYLLGGGSVITAATLSGIKIQDSINYQEQIKRYSKVKTKFAAGIKDVMEGWYLPTWQNDTIWKRQHERYISDSQNKEKFKKQFPTPKDFRDYCYKNAETTNLQDCNPSSGWCMDCGRDSSWENEKELMKE